MPVDHGILAIAGTPAHTAIVGPGAVVLLLHPAGVVLSSHVLMLDLLYRYCVPTVDLSIRAVPCT